MGRRNSSLTRVQPVFRTLLRDHPTGEGWLSSLLELAGRESPLASRLARSPGMILTECVDQHFERKLPPPTDFLIWLAKHPERMSWPEDGKRPFGSETQEWREKLFGLRGREAQRQAQTKALTEIQSQGAAKSKGKWWAFEGFTTVDCCLETDNLLLLVEGKRIDSLSPTTDWYRHRDQVSRNLEVAKQEARGKEFAVLLIAEDPYQWVGAEKGLPHYSADDRKVLVSHYLGSVSWKAVCGAVGIDFLSLPDVIEQGRGHMTPRDHFH